MEQYLTQVWFKIVVNLIVLENAYSNQQGEKAKRKMYTSLVLHKYFLRIYMNKVKKWL